MHFSVCNWIQYCDCYLVSPVGPSPHFSQYACGYSVNLISFGAAVTVCIISMFVSLPLDSLPGLLPWPQRPRALAANSSLNLANDRLKVEPTLWCSSRSRPPTETTSSLSPSPSSRLTARPCRTLPRNLQGHPKVSGWSYFHYFPCVGWKSLWNILSPRVLPGNEKNESQNGIRVKRDHVLQTCLCGRIDVNRWAVLPHWLGCCWWFLYFTHFLIFPHSFFLFFHHLICFICILLLFFLERSVPLRRKEIRMYN